MNMSDNPHCVESLWCQKYYYKLSDDGKNTVCCGVNDNPTRVELNPPGNRKYPAIPFEIPRQKYELERVESLMEQAYARGVLDRANEIGKLMKMLIAL
jgi:hypothetical protein